MSPSADRVLRSSVALQEFFKCYADISGSKRGSDEENKMDLMDKGRVTSNHTDFPFASCTPKETFLKAESFRSNPEISRKWFSLKPALHSRPSGIFVQFLRQDI